MEIRMWCSMHKHDLYVTPVTVSLVRRLRVNLKYPNVAVDEFGNLGHWTMIYNEGFEITVNQRTFFAFSYFKQVKRAYHSILTQFHALTQ